MCEALSREKGFINIRKTFGIAIVNALWRVLCNERLDYEDEGLRALVEDLKHVARSFDTPLVNLALFRPWLFECLEKFKLVTMTNDMKRIWVKVDDTIKGHRETRDPNSNRDLIDCYLEKEGKEKSFNHLNLRNVIMDLFTAGGDTTSTTLEFAMVYLVNYPEIQEKIQFRIGWCYRQGKISIVGR